MPLCALVCALLPRPARAVRDAEADLPRGLRVLLVVLDLVAGALPPLYRGDDRAPRPRRREPGHRARQQRRLPAAVLPARPACRCSAIEPTANTAQVAIDKGIPTRVEFFGVETARAVAAGDAGRSAARQQRPRPRARHQRLRRRHEDRARPAATITMEFPHLLKLIELNQWDTIYHEHYSYLSFGTVARVFAAHGLRLFDVEELPTHGGSLRIFACHDDDARRADRRARASCSSASGPPVWRTCRLPRLRRARRRRQAPDRRVPHRASRTAGNCDRRLRRAGEGQHAAELLRRRARVHRLHVRRQPAQAAPLCRARTSRSSRPTRSASASPTSC